ncbi:MAG: STAS domain-containing protein [Cyanobacteria bacterium]|nr:STAS domain-containing protein [Cyanobacteriota bacterium]
MQITERISQDVVVLELSGRLTVDDGAELLRQKIDSVVARGHNKVVLNIARVPHMDSPGLGELVRSYVTIHNVKGIMKLSGLAGRVIELLTIMKLIEVFDTYDTEQEALDSFLVTA